MVLGKVIEKPCAIRLHMTALQDHLFEIICAIIPADERKEENERNAG
jgi:hypothetical protein